MDLINALKIENNNTTTENGAFAYTSTLNYNLDFLITFQVLEIINQLVLKHLKKLLKRINFWP